jgi:hypothetical protein
LNIATLTLPHNPKKNVPAPSFHAFFFCPCPVFDSIFYKIKNRARAEKEGTKRRRGHVYEAI